MWYQLWTERTCLDAELLHVVLDLRLGRRLDGLEGEGPEQQVAHHEHADADLAEDEGHEGPEEVLEPLPGRLPVSSVSHSAVS